MKREEMERSLQVSEAHPQNIRRPSAFCVIARGYKSLDSKESDTQLSISMDSNAASRTEELSRFEEFLGEQRELSKNSRGRLCGA